MRSVLVIVVIFHININESLSLEHKLPNDITIYDVFNATA